VRQAAGTSGLLVRQAAGVPVNGSSGTFPGFAFLADIKEAMNCAGKLAVEDAHRLERNFEEAVLSSSLHQLDDAALAVNVHYYE
jgi:hypothetical protein